MSKRKRYRKAKALKDGRVVCDRCLKAELSPDPVLSYFTGERICGACAEKEDALVLVMRSSGLDPESFRMCGYVPTIRNTQPGKDSKK